VVKKPRRHTPVIVESESVAIVSPPAPLIIKLLVQKKATEKTAPGLGKISSCSILFSYSLFSHVTNMLSWDTGIEIAEEQGDYYNPLFTYREGDEASYFINFDEPKGCAADAGPSDAGEDKESLMTSSSRELVAGPVGSEGGLDIALATEALRNDELLPETTSGDLAGSGTSPATAGVSFMEPIEVSTVVKGALEDIVEEAIGAMSIVTSAPFGNAIVNLFLLPPLFLSLS